MLSNVRRPNPTSASSAITASRIAFSTDAAPLRVRTGCSTEVGRLAMRAAYPSPGCLRRESSGSGENRAVWLWAARYGVMPVCGQGVRGGPAARTAPVTLSLGVQRDLWHPGRPVQFVGGQRRFAPQYERDVVESQHEGLPRIGVDLEGFHGPPVGDGLLVQIENQLR